MLRYTRLFLLAILLMTPGLAHAQCLAGTTIISTFPFIEDFDSILPGTTPPTDWIQAANDTGGNGFNGDWNFNIGTTPNGVPGGPAGDSTSGMGTYAYMEDAGAFSEVSLFTPCFDFSV